MPSDLDARQRLIRPLDSTAQALRDWSATTRGTPAYAAARAIALATAENKLVGARRRLGRQQAMPNAPRALEHTQRWYDLAVRHLASVVSDEPFAYFTLPFDHAATIVVQAGYDIEPTQDATA